MSQHIAGVVLAGGLGRRMGGDKALVPLGGIPLAAHAVRRLAPQVGTLILNANGDPARFAALGLPVVPDEAADRAGPLAGVLAALNWLARERPETRLMASVSADAPFIPADLVSRLDAALEDAPEARVAVAQSRGQRHHVIGLWRADAAGEIAAALARGERRAETIVDRLGAVSVPFADLPIGSEAIDLFFNINTPDDLARAETILASSPSTPPPPLCGRAREGGIPERQPSGLPQPPTHKGEGETNTSERDVPFIVGVAGWKSSGKTTLVVKLIATLQRRGYRVSTIKHSHHDVAFEADGTDSARHRQAGAHEVALVTPRRWAVVSRRGDMAWRYESEPPLATIVAALAPADIVIVEGMKRAPIPKIEVRRTGQGEGPPLADRDPRVLAVASDREVKDAHVPTFALDDADGLADALLAAARLPKREEPT